MGKQQRTLMKQCCFFFFFKSITVKVSGQTEEGKNGDGANPSIGTDTQETQDASAH